jgi:hypothetical protein
VRYGQICEKRKVAFFSAAIGINQCDRRGERREREGEGEKRCE